MSEAEDGRCDWRERRGRGGGWGHGGGGIFFAHGFLVVCRERVRILNKRDGIGAGGIAAGVNKISLVFGVCELVSVSFRRKRQEK